ncbi:hypothetical protein DUNSADRAFT_7357 [Dunaliella salina]|uniref:Cardiolipin synthase N-terminal domain-containing protein n=1 Tax=Dunaliella salina TaxID=3046 RepID=A0ABQ7FUK8_DUNSA|nr:hypothetical protein DUNSADRAFT_7357 [Dunaliella salina]|eukprot:KAF5825717.1 hypothetical protein DUNSADRAFT_7357 [Dunaliella salina]
MLLDARMVLLLLSSAARPASARKHVLAGPAAWADYGRLLDESRLVHITTVDFLSVTALAPFWMLNDAEARGWEQRRTLLPILSVLPCLGPAIYLLLRPKTDLSK